MSHFKTYSAVTVIGMLAACGGGGDDGPQSVFTYQSIDSTVPGTSTIAAVGLTQSESGLPDGSTVKIGTLDREPQTLSIAGVIIDGIFQKSDGSWKAGETTVAPSELSSFSNTATYDFFVPVTVAVEGQSFQSNYIVGVATRTQDLPTGGSVNYTGQAYVEGIFGNDGTTPSTSVSSDGKLALNADFASGLVDVVINELNDPDITFDTVRLDKLKLSSGANATFSRTGTGFVSYENDNADFNPPLGTSTTESANGAFYGGDADGPVEAGGVFNVIGENNSRIFGIFAADERQ
jgi:hypothetical protein